ncbi:MFS transporter [Jannaschia sp. Os4]|uniref:MFS transporter n=1 Tax=Jannaschia sp. Os4 TaxID=2807617 RepID=UPI001939FA73|nr:MFS transporter [Jannaschia sp. Os4]MBM2576968.1 MFS transporter [Jannaschia sp. Os4]
MTFVSPPALRHPGFRLWFAAAVPFVLSLWAMRVIFGWLAWELSRDAGFVGLVAALGLVPIVVAGPVFGALVDRVDVTWALRLSSGSMAAVTAAAAVAQGAGVMGEDLLCALALALGLATAMHHPVRMSLGPRLVPPGAAVASVVALGAVNFNVARLVSPVATGAALVVWGAAPTLMLAAVGMAPLGLVAGRLHPRPLDRPRTGALGAAMREGVAHVLRAAPLRRAFALTALMSVVLRGYLELLPVMASGVHERGAEGLGLLTAASGAGALLAAAGRTGGARGGVVPALLAGMAVMAGIGMWTSWAAALAGTALVGAASTWCGVGLQQAVQDALPDDLRGRVMSLWVVAALGAVALGAGLLGVLAQAVGLPAACVVGGVAGVALALPFVRGRTT